MSTKFFTNEDKNTLLKKFAGVFEHRNVHYFDVLVGFFRSSGYFKIREYLERHDVKQVRILVGIDIDVLAAEYAAKGNEMRLMAREIRKDFMDKAFEDIQNANYSKEVEEGMKQFLHDIGSGRIQVKAHSSKKIHAKVYIFREEKKHDHGYGVVITGSSNLTSFGLKDSFEFNVELRENADIDFATETFEKLWAEATEILPEHATQLHEKTYLKDEFSPFEIYIKFLIEYFGKAVDYDPDSTEDMPLGFKRLSYQIDAVYEGYSKLKQHSGFLLADVVGLGKTVVAVMIARKFKNANGQHTSTLIICPPALTVAWEKTIQVFGLRNYKITTTGSLHKIKYPARWDLIIVDEAHKFRSDATDSFDKLQRICKTPCTRYGQIINRDDPRKKVILISATPLNNRPEDLRNLVYLFQDAKFSDLEVGNIQAFFAPLIDEYKQLKKEKDPTKIKEGIKAIYEKIRTKIIIPITVRRTRTDILNTPAYREDIEKQGITFPDVQPPEKILYQLDSELERLYDDTMLLISNPDIGLKYSRYQAIKHLSPELKSRFQKADMISEQLAKIMKTLLIKRIDSSFTAFKSSLTKFQQGNMAMIKMFDNDKIFIAPGLKGKVSTLVMEGKDDELEQLVLERMEKEDNILICQRKNFDTGFYESLLADQATLDYLVKRWQNVRQDPKLDELLRRLDNGLMNKDKNPEQKLVIFSESVVTTDYLYAQLRAKGKKVLAVKSANRKEIMPTVAENFDANHVYAKQKSQYDIVIATEVLAEGVNLHRSNVILNYDTPWNSTRLMQRIGRVNRVGSKAEQVHVYNFFPTAKVDNDIDLKKRAIMKLQAFHSALGEDSQIYSQEEEVSSFGLFDKEPDEGSERDERLQFLMELRDFKERFPKEFKRIKDMPLRARVGRKDADRKKQTISFIKSGNRDSFTLIKESLECEELTFVEAAKVFKALSDEKAIPLHDLHHQQVQQALTRFEKEREKAILSSKVVSTANFSAAEKGAIAYVKTFIPAPFVNEKEREKLLLIQDMLRAGKFAKLPREISRLRRKANKEGMMPIPVLEKLLHIAQPYVDTVVQEQKDLKTKTTKLTVPEIIISESFDF